jgi:hypothetical protein
MTYINEKYALQQYEGRITDTFISDMDEITKVAPQLMLYLYNNCVFIIKRNIILDNFKCLIYTVIYDADASDAEIESNTSRIIHDIPITGPSQCNGYAYSNNVIVWVPADLSKCPFKNEALNNQIYDGTIESAADSMDDHNYTVAINFNKLNIAPIKNSNKNAIDILFSDLSEDKIKNAKFYIALNYRSKIATLKHELTHVLDSETADKVNYYSTSVANAKDISQRISADNFYEENKTNFEMLLFILYRLWSYTEFNAFTQSYGRSDLEQETKRSIKFNNTIKSAVKNMYRDNGDSLENLESKIIGYLDKLKQCDINFWRAAREIIAEGSSSDSAADKYRNMSATQIKNYFINTSIKLVEKFKNKIVKNVSTRNTYQKDIAYIAREIFNKCSNLYIDKKSKQPTVLTLNFDFYFKNFKLSSPTTVKFTIPHLGVLARNPYKISNVSSVDVIARYLKINRHINALDFFGNERQNGFAEMLTELYTKNRKTMIEELSLNFAEDLYKALSELNR